MVARLAVLRTIRVEELRPLDNGVCVVEALVSGDGVIVNRRSIACALLAAVPWMYRST
jgi:hypothetical protein